MRKGEFIGRTLRPFLSYLPNSFICKFNKGMIYITVTNPTSKPLTLKGGMCLGSTTFETVRNMTHERNYISHFHTDLDGSFALCRDAKMNAQCKKVLLQRVMMI